MKTKNENFTSLNNSRNVIKNTMQLVVVLLISAFSFIACESDEQEEQDKPDGIALKERFMDNRQDAVQTFVLDATTGGEIVGNQGTVVFFPPNAVGVNGNPATGNFEVQLIEIYDKAAMVLQDVSTKGKKVNGDEEALQSGGEFFLNATSNGVQLDVLEPITIRDKGAAPGQFEPMDVFSAGTDMTDNDLWRAVDQDNDGQADQANQGEGPGSNGSFVLYNSFEITGFGWSNLDRWYNYTGQLTDLFVEAPSGYTGDNSVVYLSYDGESALAKLDIFDTTLQQFTEHYGRIPVGLQVHLIMVTDIGGQIHYAIKPVTIVNNQVETITNLQPISETALTTLLNGLP